MKKTLLIVISVILSGYLSVYPQSTDGTLTFSWNQPVPTSPSGNKNVIAVWIENNSGTFIKTKIKYTNSETEHLPTWRAKSSQNVTDATTGATRTTNSNPTAFGTKSFSWDGTDASAAPPNGVLVADGTYKVWIESAWQNNAPANSHNAITSFSFTKGTSEVHLTPTGDNYFNTITLDWVPASLSTEHVPGLPMLVAYPNPARGIFNIDYYQTTDIEVLNILGSVIYKRKTENTDSGNMSVDLRNFPDGIYFINVINGEKSAKYKVVLNK